MTCNEDINNASYKFNSNLIKLSTSDNIEDAKNEWEFILKKTEKDNNNLCICQHKIKHITYFYNIKNKNTIICGSKCCEKFKFSGREMKNKILSNILFDSLTKGDYKQINNLLKYSNDIKNTLIKQFTREYENKINNQYELKLLLNNIEELINYYSFDNLENIKNLIIDKLNKLTIEHEDKLIKEKLKKEKLKKEKDESKQIKEFLTKEQNEYNSNIRMLNIYYNSNKAKYDENDNENELMQIIKYNMIIYNIFDINEIINYKPLNENIIKIETEQQNINCWTCQFCNLSKPEMHGLFFNDMICTQCARKHNNCLAF